MQPKGSLFWPQLKESGVSVFGSWRLSRHSRNPGEEAHVHGTLVNAKHSALPIKLAQQSYQKPGGGRGRWLRAQALDAWMPVAALPPRRGVPSILLFVSTPIANTFPSPSAKPLSPSVSPEQSNLRVTPLSSPFSCPHPHLCLPATFSYDSLSPTSPTLRAHTHTPGRPASLSIPVSHGGSQPI